MTNQIFDLSGKVAVVTGSSRGIGKAIATQLSEAGAKVVISSRKLEACELVRQELKDRGKEAISIACNVSLKSDLEKLIEETKKVWGKIDILVCNAATNPVYGPSLDLAEEAFDKIMNTNVKSIYLLCNMVLPEMAERKDGSIIIISSIAAIRGSSVLGAYAISKAAEAQLARNLAVEWGPHNVRINAIAPGLIKTDFAKALWDNPKLLKQQEAMTPLRRIGEPEEIAGLAVCLAAPAGRYMTGQYIVVDGGATIAGTF
jgi:NAD(P)-dependent dehydrogenase (short-subunit alcohol dehydrogenase family)